MDTNHLAEVRDFVRQVDPDLQRIFDFTVEEVRDSNAGADIYTVKGHAAVFNKWSLDLGGFREKIKPGAFDNALSNDPHVLHLWDHDTSRALSSTRSKTYPLELRTDPAGLRFYSKVAPTSYSADLRTLLEGGVIDQSSFAFTVKADEWKIREVDGQEIVERTILDVDQLFDVTTCAMGAYPTTDSALAVRSISLGRRASGTATHVASTAIPVHATFTPGVWVNGVRMVGEQTQEVAPPDEPVTTLEPDEVGTPGPPTTGEPAPDPQPDRDEQERNFKKWQTEKALAYRRTREFAFGVHNPKDNR